MNTVVFGFTNTFYAAVSGLRLELLHERRLYKGRVHLHYPHEGVGAPRLAGRGPLRELACDGVLIPTRRRWPQGDKPRQLPAIHVGHPHVKWLDAAIPI